MKYKKLIVSIIIMLAVFLIYIMTVDHKINYLALGDSLAIGQNPYKQIGHGYSDLVANYLERNDLLKKYTKDFSVSGYKTKDLYNDIINNKTIEVSGKQIHLKQALSDANLITLSIGANDMMNQLDLPSLLTDSLTYDKAKEYIDDVIPKLDQLLKEIRKYAHGDLLVIGYYNPLPRLTKGKTNEMDRIFQYMDKEFAKVSEKYKATYIDNYTTFKGRNDYLPNPFDIHPNNDGYQAMANRILNHIEKEILH